MLDLDTRMHRLKPEVQVDGKRILDLHVPKTPVESCMSQAPLYNFNTKIYHMTYMSRGMGPTKAKLVVISLIWAILVLESEQVSGALEDLVLVQCKHNCKHDLHNKETCEDRCHEKMMTAERKTSGQEVEEEDPFCEAFCKSFEGQGLYQHCMTTCPRAKFTAKMMAIERQGGESSDGVAIGDLQTKCNRKCISNTEPKAHKRCMSGCFMSMKIDNEAVCEESCSIVQEKPLTIQCIRVCHERIPGAVDSS